MKKANVSPGQVDGDVSRTAEAVAHVIQEVRTPQADVVDSSPAVVYVP